jgi:hypothetical protein
MLVSDLRERISNQEYIEWYVYFARKAQRQELESKRAQSRRG